MKYPFVHPLRCWLPCLGLILMCVSASAQGEVVQTSKPINLDKELEGQAAQDRAASYYHFSLAKWNEDNGDLPKAISEMQTALKYNRISPAIHLEMAALLEKSGNTREAIGYAQEAVRLDPQDPDPHWLLANIFFRPQEQGNPSRDGMQKAVQELEKLREMTPDDERTYYALGGAYFELDEPEKAIQAYEKFQSLALNADNGYREIARYYDRKGDHEKAIEYLAKGLKARPGSAESLSMLGAIYSRLNKNKEAIPVYRKLQEVTGNNLVISRQLAESLIETGEYNEAVEILEHLLKAVPKDQVVQMLLGRTQIGRREYLKAIETLQPLAADPGAVDAQFYLGTAYEQVGKVMEATKIFLRLLEMTPADTEEAKSNRLAFQQHLAVNYQEMGENDKAIEIYVEMVKSDPKLSPQLVNAYRINRQFDKALSLGKPQYEKDPNDTKMAVVYARTLADANKAKKGVEILSRLLQSNPKDVDIYVNLSQVYMQDERYADAEKIIRQAEEKKLDSEMDKERLKFQLATVYERQKNFDRAESLFKEILKANPNNAVALNYIGYMLADRGVRLEEALKYVKEALAIEPYKGAYLDSLGWAFFKLNDMENAEKYLLEADQIVKNDPIIDEHLGDLYYKTGNLAKAQDFWTKSISIGTEPEDIQKVRRKLQMLQETLQRQKSAK